MWSDFIFINIDEQNNRVTSSGLDFHDFTKALGVSDNYLILAGEPTKTKFNMNLLMEYISSEQVKDFLGMDVENWGDFCWVDFQNEKSLDELSKEELAELLYMKHKKQPLHSYQIKGLNNSFAYLCHDDGVWNNVYMKELSWYRNAIKYMVDKYNITNFNLLKGRERVKLEMNDESIQILFKLAYSGLILDFKEVSSGSICCYNMDKTVKTIDELEEIIHVKRKLYQDIIEKRGE